MKYEYKITGECKSCKAKYNLTSGVIDNTKTKAKVISDNKEKCILCGSDIKVLKVEKITLDDSKEIIVIKSKVEL